MYWLKTRPPHALAGETGENVRQEPAVCSYLMCSGRHNERPPIAPVETRREINGQKYLKKPPYNI